MNKKQASRLISILLCSGVLALQGCLAAFKDGRSSSGAVPIVKSNKDLYTVDLALALNPNMYAVEQAIRGNAAKGAPLPNFIDMAFNHFSSLGDESLKQRKRNAIQARLTIASDQACNEFKKQLHALQAEGNFLLGSLTTALAGAGAIVPVAFAARLLSGSAGIFSGVRAEFNENFFRQLTVEVITKAIDGRRGEMRQELENVLLKETLVYPVEAAVADAIRYNDVCTLIGGLQLASTAVTVAEDPGLNRLSKILNNSSFTGSLQLNVTGKPAVNQTSVTLADGSTVQVSKLSPALRLKGAKNTIESAVTAIGITVVKQSLLAENLLKAKKLSGEKKAEVDKQHAAERSKIDKAQGSATAKIENLIESGKAEELRTKYFNAWVAAEAAPAANAGVKRSELGVKEAEMKEFVAGIDEILMQFSKIEASVTDALDIVASTLSEAAKTALKPDVTEERVGGN